MPGNSGQRRGQRRARAQSLVLLVAGLWLLILFTCAAGPWLSAASARSRSLLLPQLTVTVPVNPTPTNTVAGPTATPTTGGGKPTATAPVGPTATGAATVTPTATPVVNGGGDNGGGGGGGGGYQGSGPQPTRVVLAQPTAGAGGGGGVGGLSPAAFGSNGLLVATTLSCVVAILGIVIAVIALSVLVRTGYGPFLRALVLGKRAGRRSTSEVLPAGAANGGRSGGWTHRDDVDGRYDDTRGSRDGRQGPASPVAGRSPQARQAPVARSRSDWR